MLKFNESDIILIRIYSWTIIKLVLSFNYTQIHTHSYIIHYHQPSLKNLDFKQGIAGKVSCSSSLSGEGHLAVGPPDPMTTLRWYEKNSMVDDVCHNQPSSHLGWAIVSDKPKSLYSPSISTSSSHQYKEAPAVPAALSTTAARTNSTCSTRIVSPHFSTVVKHGMPF